MRAIGGDSVAIDAFRKRWEQPGFVTVSADGADTAAVTVIYFMRTATRERWRNGQTFRTQQYAPPNPLPPGAVAIYISGTCPARKKNQPPPPAGYGCNMVAADEGQIFTCGGQIVTGVTLRERRRAHGEQLECAGGSTPFDPSPWPKSTAERRGTGATTTAIEARRQ